MSSVPKKIEKKVVKKVYAATIQFYPDGTSTIIRPNMPMLIDKTDKAVSWLKDNGFKVEDIEVIGDKPSCWDIVYPAPVPDPAMVEKLAAVLDGKPAEPAPTPAPVADPIIDPVVQALGIPEDKVESTVLTETFVPAPPIVAPADATSVVEPPKA
jgi:hypothetical protein